MKRYGGKIIRRIPQFLPWRQRRSPDEAKRNPGLKLTQLRPRISLRSIRATKVTFGRPSIICEFGAGLGPTLLDAARLTIYPISASA